MGALESMIEERINRFRALSEKMEVSIALGEKIRYKKTILKQKKEFLENWPEIKTCFKNGHETRIDQKNRDDFAGIIHHKINRGEKNYLQVIKSLDKRESAIGTQWLHNIVDDITRSSLNHLPSFRL